MTDANLHALPPGHEFDGYRILRTLGAGGFGITYLAEEIAIGRKVAIKEYLPQGFAARTSDTFNIRPVSAGSQQQFSWGLERFRQEAQTLVAFEHPNIVSVYRYFEAHGTAYLVMQYVEGKPLDALLAGGKTLAESEIEEVIFPILDGLEEVHKAKFLHRDIKPANIYIRKDGRPVLLDFGAARQAFGSETKSITAIVSEGYAPFEQYEAKGDQGPWTDVYALGAVLYRCIAGERPSAAPERISARLRSQTDPMRSVREFAPGQYSAKLLAAVERALGVTREERPQSVAELRAILRGAAPAAGASEKLSARPVAAPGAQPAHVAPVRSRSKAPLVAGLAAVLVAGGGAGAYFVTRSPPSAPADTALASPAQRGAGAEAERIALSAAEEAGRIVERARQALDKGELERGREDLRFARRRVEEALRQRPRHGALEAALAKIAAAESDLARRIAERVKELANAAESDAARAPAEAERKLEEVERLDPAAAKAARERVAAARRRAEAEKIRSEEERKRHDAARQQDEQRRAQAEAQAKFAGQRLDQAKDALARNRFADARRLTDDAEGLLKQAATAAAGSLVVAAVQRDIDAFRRELTARIADRVASLLRQARVHIQAGRLEEADKQLDEAEDLEPSSSEVTATRRDYQAARRRVEETRKNEEERRRRDEAERKRKEEEARKPTPDKLPAPPVASAGAVQLAGRTATLSRISSERRAVMRVQLAFAAGGALNVTCVVEMADGGQSACFGERSGGGRWSLTGSTLCLSSPVINLPTNACYQVSGTGNQMTLSGAGLLAGTMFVR